MNCFWPVIGARKSQLLCSIRPFYKLIYVPIHKLIWIQVRVSHNHSDQHLGTQLGFITSFPESTILLVSTKHRDLWPIFIEYAQSTRFVFPPIRFGKLDNESVNHELQMLGPANLVPSVFLAFKIQSRHYGRPRGPWGRGWEPASGLDAWC